MKIHIHNMKDHKVEAGIADIGKLLMTADEKEKVLQKVLDFSLSIQPVRSPWAVYFVSLTKKYRVLSYAIAAFLILGLGSTGIAYASTGSLPGNVLYPIKVTVVEPLHAALTFSLKAKALYESSLATKRLVEAETLANENKLDASKEEKLNTLLVTHTNALHNTLDKIRETKSTDTTGPRMVSDDNNAVHADDDIITNFQASMNAHARILDMIRDDDMNDLVTKEDNQFFQISKTARDNSGSIRNNLKNSDTEERNTTYIERKKNIQSLIDSTTTNLNQSNTNLSQGEKNIIDDAHKTLDQAKQFLKEADEEDTKGDSESAYSKLIDSESSAKEAGIFLRTGLKLKDRND